MVQTKKEITDVSYSVRFVVKKSFFGTCNFKFQLIKSYTQHYDELCPNGAVDYHSSKCEEVMKEFKEKDEGLAHSLCGKLNKTCVID